MSSATKMSSGKCKSPTAKLSKLGGKGDRASTSHSNYLTVQEEASPGKQIDDRKPSVKRSVSKHNTSGVLNTKAPSRQGTKQFTPVLNVDKSRTEKQAK